MEVPASDINYSKLYNDPKFTDFTLKSSDGKGFKVHRNVLAYESDFFMKLFTTDQQEKPRCSATFNDIDSSAMQEVLNFIYNEEAEIEDIRKASSLIYAAEKFNLPALKLFCIEELEEKVCKENALEILAIAEMFNDKGLEDVCLLIIIE